MELPSGLVLQLQELGAQILAKGAEVYQKGFEDGVASVPPGSGKSDEEVAQLVSEAVAAKVASLKEALKSIDASEDAAVDALFV